jgi:chemosensory pili system protein ChpA (sensor histidine kinase/response regulator)
MTKLPHIIICDDNDGDRRLLQLAFMEKRPHGLQISLAGSGEEALEMLATAAAEDNLPSLVVTDHLMPGMDGLDLIKYIRESAILRNIPVALITGRVLPDHHANAPDYLTTKPMKWADYEGFALSLLIKFLGP